MPNKQVMKLFRVGEVDVIIYPLPENLPAGEYRVQYSIYPAQRADEVKVENERCEEDCTVHVHCICDSWDNCGCDTEVIVCGHDDPPVCRCNEKEPPPCRCEEHVPPCRHDE